MNNDEWCWCWWWWWDESEWMRGKKKKISLRNIIVITHSIRFVCMRFGVTFTHYIDTIHWCDAYQRPYGCRSFHGHRWRYVCIHQNSFSRNAKRHNWFEYSMKMFEFLVKKILKFFRKINQRRHFCFEFAVFQSKFSSINLMRVVMSLKNCAISPCDLYVSQCRFCVCFSDVLNSIFLW